jgi:hypothetical protein
MPEVPRAEAAVSKDPFRPLSQNTALGIRKWVGGFPILRAAEVSPNHGTRILRASVDWQAGGTFVLGLGVRNFCSDHILITLQSRHTLTMVSRFCHSKDEISASQV